MTYRLGAPYDEQLRVAAHAAGLTPNQYARLVLAQHFEKAKDLDAKDAFEELLAELRDFRAAFDDALE